MNWLDELKIALVENNLERASFLVETCPFLNDPCHDLEVLQSAGALIATTIERLQEEQRTLGAQMRQLKAAQKFLEIP
ncbi:hypothetical protein [Helicobacter ailurogastricus]|uniref:Uncharacterized protein n=1 Tax=Helicobacter ailurogastricus TaxID=1578720 RepID=A0A0K2XC95_9HELI|nr:hypothetical protein [Helicobacter ailurogastricus]CRF41021.1 hypothetical protein HAL011_07970 [Helicobacter ailurogastricus]CRF42309.1 hypothetical protein HAL013_04780 [Helicobacter ailurogastricus]CRF44793.1 hypothetical protein HAL09_14050 [Helicobacter ailurogastricus]CRF52004.1 hypothetical protein HAL07_01300 [Helicobacter ailurogastricus]BDQ29118.1 hypothetical protein ASB7_09550 [Helicobacter ailurogastricus]